MACSDSKIGWFTGEKDDAITQYGLEDTLESIVDVRNNLIESGVLFSYMANDWMPMFYPTVSFE